MSSRTRTTTSNDWIRIHRDQETGIETVHAHFRGHAYDPHDHDEILVGVTQQGVQQFRCHRSLHTSRRLARDQSLDRMMGVLSRHLSVETPRNQRDSVAKMERAKDFLHAQMDRDIGLDELASYSGMDRFRLTRQFQRTYGLSPHAYLVRLRLRTARALLANGQGPAQVATKVGFADQSHLGRWFQRAYRLTPAAYQRQCTNVLD